MGLGRHSNCRHSRKYSTWEDRGLCTHYEHGITDEGDPWISFFDEHDGSFVAHVACDTGEYLLACSDDTVERSLRCLGCLRLSETDAPKIDVLAGR